MKTILGDPTLSTIFLFVCTALIMSIQYFFGYKNWKLLGFLLPVMLLLFVAYCFYEGKMTLSVRDFLMPFIGLLVLGTAYERGYRKAKAKQNKELERMKAQDNLI